MFSALFKRRKKTSTASIAKERLQIIVAHERGQGAPSQEPDFLQALQKDILEVVRKYMAIDGDQIKVAMDKEDGFDVLELNITLSEKEEEALEAKAAAEAVSEHAETSHETR